MSEGIVHILEPVKIDKQYRDEKSPEPWPRPGLLLQRFAMVQSPAVGKNSVSGSKCASSSRRSLRNLTIGDVLHDPGNLIDRSLGILDREGPDMHPAHNPVGSHDPANLINAALPEFACLMAHLLRGVALARGIDAFDRKLARLRGESDAASSGWDMSDFNELVDAVPGDHAPPGHLLPNGIDVENPSAFGIADPQSFWAC